MRVLPQHSTFQSFLFILLICVFFLFSCNRKSPDTNLKDQNNESSEDSITQLEVLEPKMIVTYKLDSLANAAQIDSFETRYNKEQKDIIFERFRQGNDELNRNYEGAGLGLAISKAFVEMLGGKIWVESDEENTASNKNGSTTFYFTIPYDI